MQSSVNGRPDDEELQGKRVVVVEDEGITQMQLRMALRKAGLQVVGAAGTGPAGVEVALREHPDIILMDINMPGQFDGLEAARRILSQYPACIVMLTAYSEFRSMAEEIGACGYVTKPLDDSMLLPELLEAWTRYEGNPKSADWYPRD